MIIKKIFIGISNKMSADFVNYLVNHKTGNLLKVFLPTVIEDNNVEMFKYLLEQGISPNSYQGCSPLLTVVALHGNVEQCELLIKAGADINRTDIFECTALHRSVERRLVPIIELLLRYNIDISYRNNLDRAMCHENARISNGKTAKDIALEKGFQEIVELIEKYEFSTSNKPEILLN